MSFFPSQNPTGRQLKLGFVPVETFTSLSGKETRVVVGNKRHGHELSLKFENVREGVAKQISNHWYGRQGTLLSFQLPDSVFEGWDAYPSSVPVTQNWRYASEPSIDAVAPGIMNVSVELVALA